MTLNGKFYMAYTADLHIGIAVSDSPTGPFVQSTEGWVDEEPAIDGHFFRDDDCTLYLFYVRLSCGANRIFGAKLDPNLTEILKDTEKLLITPEEEWEICGSDKVTEGPFVLKHNGKYFLSYSANDYQSPYYAIGYAVSDSPLGPYRKAAENPILKRNEHFNGTGHHSFTVSEDGKHWICVYHVHHSLNDIHPRMVCIDRAEFVLDERGESALRIYGPTEENTLQFDV